MLPGLVLDFDASLVTCHSEKESAAATFKGGFGYHPLLAFLDNTGEALAGLLRPGQRRQQHRRRSHRGDRSRAGPDPRHRPIRFPDPDPGRRRRCHQGLAGAPARAAQPELDVEFSVGFTMTPAVQAAIDALPKAAWTPAIDADGSVRDGADVAEITGFLNGLTTAGWPDRMRVIVRRERPHPGAQLSLFDQHHGLRYQAFATDTPTGQLAHLEARHRAHARVEDRIRAPRTPASAGSRPGSSHSTPPGSNSRSPASI